MQKCIINKFFYKNSPLPLGRYKLNQKHGLNKSLKYVIAYSIVPGCDVFGVRALTYWLQSALLEIKINRRNGEKTTHAFVMFHKLFSFNLKKCIKLINS